MNNILIIGYGYIGSKIVDYFDKKKYNITCITRNKNELHDNYKNVEFIIGRYESLDKSFYSVFDTIILTAGQSSKKSCNNLLQTLYNDLLAFSYITEILDDNQKLIYMSSGVVNDHDNKNYYSIVKTTINEITNVINTTTNKQLFGLVLGTVNGVSPIIRTDLMLNKMVYDAINTYTINIFDAHCERQILYINDLCNAIDIIIKKGNIKNRGIYDIYSFNSTVEILAHNVKTILPNTVVVYNEKNENDYQYKFSMDSKKFISTFSESISATPNLVYKIILELIVKIKDTISNVQTKKVLEFKQNFEYTKNCIVCNTNTKQLLNLGYQPLANNYHKPTEIIDSYPLGLDYCENCFHVQLNCVVNPDILFKNYLYVSGTSNTGLQYFKNFAKNCINNNNVSKVLDIACNDGSQLDAFKNIDKHIITVGVDPAVNLSIISKSKGHDIFCDFFNIECCKSIIEKYGENSFDIIIAQNVFAHINYPNEFLKLCSKLLSKNGKLFIQTSQANMIINNEFDTAYHEHLSFFNTNSMNILCKNHNMTLINSSRVDIHGISYLFEICNSVCEINNKVNESLYYEIEKELYNIETYKKYPIKCNIYKNKFANTLLTYKLDNYNIIGVGSTAKSNTLLNFCNIGNDIIDFIIDENKLKQNLLTPGSNILITDISVLQNLDVTKKYAIVIFGWNYYTEILSKILNKINIDNFDIINVNPLETFKYIDKKLIE